MAEIIIIGGGTAGITLARELSRRFRVVVFEQGADNSTEAPISDPLYANSLVTAYTNEYFAMYGHAEAPRRFVPMAGETLGGGSSVNGMQLMTGAPSTYDNWASLVDDKSWDAKHAKKVYKRFQNFNGVPGYYDPNAHSTGGPVDIRQGVVNLALGQLFANSVASTQHTTNHVDPNDFSNTFGGTPYYQLTQQPDKKRESSWTAYAENLVEVKPGKWYRKSCDGSLTVYTSARLTKLLWEGCRVTGVEISRDGRCRSFCAREVIITCGLGSAVILQQNGIGPRDLLESLSVPVKVDSPHVGQHLLNHPIVTLLGAGNLPPVTPGDDAQALYDGCAVLDYNGDGTRSFQLFNVRAGVETIAVGGLILNATSEGSIDIQYASPDRAPTMVLNTLTTSEDQAKAVYLYKVLYNIIKTMGLTPLGPAVTAPDSDILTFIQASYGIAYHYVSMCRMARCIEEGVVDSDCKVFGVEGLRVCDTSVVPLNASGNTMAPAYFVALTLAKKMLR